MIRIRSLVRMEIWRWKVPLGEMSREVAVSGVSLVRFCRVSIWAGDRFLGLAHSMYWE